MKKRSLVLWGIAALLAVSLLLLPAFLSSNLVLDRLFSRLNKEIPGTLSVDSCSIGWQRGLQCSGLVYADKSHGTTVTIPQLSGSQGLLALAVAPSNLGTITLRDPLVVLPPLPAAEARTTPAKTSPPPAPKGRDAAEKKGPAAGRSSTPLWDRLTGKLVVKGAVVRRKIGAGPARILIRKGSLKARLAEGSIHFEAGIESANNGGSATATGFVNLPARPAAFLDTLVTETTLHVMDLQLEPFFTLVPASLDPPRGTGELSAELLIKMSGLDNLTARGTAMVRDLQLSGGVLGQDRPSFKQVNFDIDARRESNTRWQFPDLNLSADFGTMQLKGTADGPEMSLQGKGSLLLPVLFQQFPHLLRVQPGTELKDGTMELSLLMTRDRQRLDGAVDAVIKGISGRTGEHHFSWNTPLDCSLSGSMVGGEPMISKLKIKAPFLDLEGEGDLKTFELQGTADLAEMMEEAGTLFDLDWQGRGRMRLSAGSREESPGRYVIDTDIAISDFSLSRGGRAVMPSHEFSFSGRLHSPAKLPESGKEAAELHFDLSAWPGKISGRLGSLFRRQENWHGDCELQGDLQLARLSDLLHNTDLSGDMTLAGRMALDATAGVEGKTVLLRRLDTRITDLIFYQKGTMFRDPQVRLWLDPPAVADPVGRLHPLVVAEDRASFFARGGRDTLIDLEDRRAYVHDLRATSEKGTLDIKNLAVEDWQRLPTSLAVEAKGDVDFDRLTPLLHRAGLLPQDQSPGGRADFSIRLDREVKGSQAGEFRVALAQGSLVVDNRELLQDQDLEAKVKFQGNLEAGDLALEDLDLRTEMLELQGSGKLQRSGKAPFFSLAGFLTPDFSGLSQLASTLTGMDIQGSGGGREPFKLLLPLAGPEAKPASLADFSTRLTGDRLQALGVRLDQVAMPVSLSQGKLAADLTAGANGGRLELSPRVNLAAEPPELVLPAGEQVLSRVGISEPLVNGLLKGIHPILGLLARPSGSISARVDRFSWPLTENGSRLARFSTVLNLSRVQLAPEGVLAEVLELVRLGDQPLSLKQSEITCKGENGRVTCTPLKILIAGSEMTLAGSIGFDGSIDYLLQVPVTEQLVGKEGYRVLEGTTLKVPIKGDRDRAVFDRRALGDALTDLLVQAGTSEVGKVLQEQAGKVLPGLIDDLLGK